MDKIIVIKYDKGEDIAYFKDRVLREFGYVIDKEVSTKNRQKIKDSGVFIEWFNTNVRNEDKFVQAHGDNVIATIKANNTSAFDDVRSELETVFPPITYYQVAFSARKIREVKIDFTRYKTGSISKSYFETKAGAKLELKEQLTREIKYREDQMEVAQRTLDNLKKDLSKLTDVRDIVKAARAAKNK